MKKPGKGHEHRVEGVLVCGAWTLEVNGQFICELPGRGMMATAKVIERLKAALAGGGR